MGVSVLAAFVGGLFSFFSPCVLPLVPGYVSMLSGIGVEQLRQGETPRNSLMSSAIAFVIGFSVVFIAFGASASAVGHFLSHNRTLLAPIAGALILLFGLHLIGVLARISFGVGAGIAVVPLALALIAYLRPGVFGDSWGVAQFLSLSMIPLLGPALGRWLSRDVRFRNLGGGDANEKSGPFAGILSGFLMGFAFAFGWTPCIGPILATVLAMAATTENIARGVFLLAIYSAGLGIPFLLFALGINKFLSFYKKFRKYLQVMEVASGFLLLAVGFLIFTNSLTWLSGKLAFMNVFAKWM
jgi:cytochrome c-type biogenesis protein